MRPDAAKVTSRKHTYGGFAAGLGAPEYWNDAK